MKPENPIDATPDDCPMRDVVKTDEDGCRWIIIGYYDKRLDFDWTGDKSNLIGFIKCLCGRTPEIAHGSIEGWQNLDETPPVTCECGRQYRLMDGVRILHEG